ncbi:MAG: serine hydrolase, partial [Ginsengibacter sp.]
MNIIITLFSLFFCSSIYSQKIDHKLEKKIASAINGFHGDVGVYVYSFSNNKVVEINADSIFPTASMVKVPILIGIMHKINNGEL